MKCKDCYSNLGKKSNMTSSYMYCRIVQKKTLMRVGTMARDNEVLTCDFIIIYW
jgi:hypothetical protein